MRPNQAQCQRMLPGALECRSAERFFAGASASRLSEPPLRSRKRPPAQCRVTVHFLIVFVEQILHASLQREPRVHLPCSVNPHDRVVFRVDQSKRLRVYVTPVRGKRNPPPQIQFPRNLMRAEWVADRSVECNRNGAPPFRLSSRRRPVSSACVDVSVRDGSARFRTGSPEFFLPHMAPQNPPVDRPPNFPPQP